MSAHSIKVVVVAEEEGGGGVGRRGGREGDGVWISGWGTKRGQPRTRVKLHRPTSVMNTSAKEAGIPRASHSASGLARMCCIVGLMPGRCTPSCSSDGLFMPARCSLPLAGRGSALLGFVRAVHPKCARARSE